MARKKTTAQLLAQLRKDLASKTVAELQAEYQGLCGAGRKAYADYCALSREIADAQGAVLRNETGAWTAATRPRGRFFSIANQRPRPWSHQATRVIATPTARVLDVAPSPLRSPQ